MNYNGTEHTQVSARGFRGDWSPDGTRIVFSSYPREQADIVVINVADTSDKVRLTNDGANNWAPVWSPDGQRIAFAKSGVLHVMKVDGSNPVALANGTGPAWSPDGQFIAVASQGPSGGESFQIWTIRANGTGLTRLTSISPDCGGPSYVPDGRAIVFHCPRQGTESFVWIMDADGGNQRRLDAVPWPGAAHPDWFEPPAVPARR
ncbi:MAG: PD40 domain-containing protein [Gemmatimonadetes bacterium]|nr:PD40 domain-containing protein [Gemmatimonadota bacterium]